MISAGAGAKGPRVYHWARAGDPKVHDLPELTH